MLEHYIIYKNCCNILGEKSSSELINFIDSYIKSNIVPNIHQVTQQEVFCNSSNEVIYQYLPDSSTLFLSKDEIIDFGFNLNSSFKVNIDMSECCSLVKLFLSSVMDIIVDKVEIVRFETY